MNDNKRRAKVGKNVCVCVCERLTELRGDDDCNDHPAQNGRASLRFDKFYVQRQRPERNGYDLCSRNIVVCTVCHRIQIAKLHVT